MQGEVDQTGASGPITTVLSLALLAYVCSVIAFRSAVFPALHGDEAYFGLAALELLQHGLTSPHASNTYTGPVQAEWVALMFRCFGRSLAALRSSAVLANCLAFAAWGLLRWRDRGARSALTLWLLIAASPWLMLMARLAWEVSALQNLFFVGLFAPIAACEHKARPGRLASGLYLYAAWLGVSSHFIFITVLIALTLGAIALARSMDAERAAPWLQLTAAGLVLGALLFVVKPRLPLAHFAEHVALYTALWLVTPALASCALQASAVERFTIRCLRAVAPVLPRLFTGLTIVSGLWFVGSGLGLGVLDLLAGSVLYKGFAALVLPLWLVVPLYLMAAALLGLALWEIVRVLRDRTGAPTDQWLALALAVWPLCFLVSGTFKTSMRYYLVIYPALLWLLANRIERRATFRGWLLPSVLVSACAGGLLWLPITRGMHGEPSKFRMGNRLENAHHYLPLTELLAQARTQRVCHFEGDHFLMEPLTFLAQVQPYPCDAARVLQVRYTLDHAPYWAAELSTPTPSHP